MKNKSTQERITQILKSIENNKDKIVRLEDKIDQIKDKEEQFQARVALLNYHQNTAAK